MERQEILDLNMVQDVKRVFTVNGAPAVKTDRFTQAELNAHFPSKNARGPLVQGCKVFSDEEILEQLYLYLNLNKKDEYQIANKIESLYFSLSYKDEAEDSLKFFKELKEFIGQKGYFHRKFWESWGSVPYVVNVNEDHWRKDMKDIFKKYDCIGADQLFMRKDSLDNLSLVYVYDNEKDNFSKNWNKENKARKERSVVYSSPYKSWDDVQENVTMKNIKVEGRKFYLDLTKPMKERLKAFNEIGEKEGYIFEPKDPILARIFRMEIEDSYYERRQDVDCFDILQNWMYDLDKNRKEEGSRKTILKERNYVASKAAMDRLRTFYFNRLMLEGIHSFNFDW